MTANTYELYWWEHVAQDSPEWEAYVIEMKREWPGWMTPQERHAQHTGSDTIRATLHKLYQRQNVQYLAWLRQRARQEDKEPIPDVE